MPRPLVLLLLLAAALASSGLTACQFPRDVGGTLDNVKGGTLRVGLTEAEPWVSLRHTDPSGVEVRLVREFAAKIGAARVDYTTGTEEELVEALHARELDVVIGGITDKTRWKKEVAITKPYLTTHLVIGMPPGADLQDGTRVITENGRSAAALVERKTNAVPVRSDDLSEAQGKPAAVDEWLLDDLGLRNAKSLEANEHVMLAAPGENGFLVELERFLLDRKERALELLEREGRP